VELRFGEVVILYQRIAKVVRTRSPIGSNSSCATSLIPRAKTAISAWGLVHSQRQLLLIGVVSQKGFQANHTVSLVVEIVIKTETGSSA
jgi:hypothetical protein